MGLESCLARDRKETELKLIKATGRVLARDGFRKFGVNAIAREAGLDKVLIYRYFDGLPGLIKAYAKQGDFWPSIDELLGEPIDSFRLKSSAQQIATIVNNHAEGIRKRPLTLQILAWEMVERNELTTHLEEVRERGGIELSKLLQQEARGDESVIDIAALIAIFVASNNYLAARSQRIRIFNGIEIKEDRGWKRLTDTMQIICEKLI